MGVPLPLAIDSDLVVKQEIGLIAVYLCEAPTRPLGIYRLAEGDPPQPVPDAAAPIVPVMLCRNARRFTVLS
jgi:hypothetical protein